MADEKFDEKDREKRDEKAEEKSPEEKWQRDPLSGIIWAAIFIWAGLVFLASNLGLLNWMRTQAAVVTGLSIIDNTLNAWPLVLAGAGVIVLLSVVVRLLVPAYRRPVWGSIIIGVILLSLGLSDLINWGIIWAVLLIIAGILILTRGMRRPRS